MVPYFSEWQHRWHMAEQSSEICILMTSDGLGLGNKDRV